MKFLPGIAALFLIASLTQAKAIGFQREIVSDPSDKQLEVGIWYPSNSPVPGQDNTPFRQALALGGKLEGQDLPLIVLSHGYGGWMGSHAGLAQTLTRSGYIVVAPNHTGNNYEDESYPPQKWMIDRPRHIKLVIDFMLNNWKNASKVAPSKIGMFGFSAGAYTALVSSGAVPNIKRLISHCDKNPTELVCKLGINDEFKASGLENLPRSAWNYDPRITAAVVVAPGLGFAFDKKGLENVTAPIQLWAGSKDLNVPTMTNTNIILKGIPIKPEYHLINKAGHFAFLPPCNPLLEEANPRVWKMVCLDDPAFNRHSFHKEFNKEITAFYNKTLTNK
ncbi:alpha/beta hydrolase family protein [Kiloniella sp.]|uniref:alpha/beta hydrolase family protein n=1 Tax=Kiloniella sp. TaxID=1938587 RepID=UPI003B016C64